jgi:hypothetical protein
LESLRNKLISRLSSFKRWTYTNSYTQKPRVRIIFETKIGIWWEKRGAFVPTLTAVLLWSSSLDPRLAELILEELRASFVVAGFATWDIILWWCDGEDGRRVCEAILECCDAHTRPERPHTHTPPHTLLHTDSLQIMAPKVYITITLLAYLIQTIRKIKTFVENGNYHSQNSILLPLNKIKIKPF